MSPDSNQIKIDLLAHRQDLIETVGEMRWQEWGHAAEPEDREWWVKVSGLEAGTDQLPVTWVAIDEKGEAIGAVGLGKFDIGERQDRSPWLIGMIVRNDLRGGGIGRLLLTNLEVWAKAQGFDRLWVANEGPAVAFYQKCGWELIETFQRTTGETITVLTKNL